MPPINGRDYTWGGPGGPGGGTGGPGGGLGGIPRAIHNDNALDIQSNLSMGKGFDQGGVGGGKGNNWQETCQGGESQHGSKPQRPAMTMPLSNRNLIGKPGSRAIGTKPLHSATRHWGNKLFVLLHS